jgi:hypothetical protein
MHDEMREKDPQVNNLLNQLNNNQNRNNNNQANNNNPPAVPPDAAQQYREHDHVDWGFN